MIVAITGQMRSGTSAVAQVVHNFGVPVAVHTPAPIPPTWRLDWEDSILSEFLGSSAQLDPEWFAGYIARRKQHAFDLFGTEDIAIKSPFLALSRDVIEICADLLDETVYWIVLRRPQKDIEASMDQFPYLNYTDNERIRKVLSTFRRGPVRRVRMRLVDYQELVANPTEVVGALAGSLGLHLDPEHLARAVACVQKPTPKTGETSWLQSH